MKRLALLAIAAGTTFTAAAQTTSFVDRARVTRVDPQYETLQVPREECRTDWVTETRPVAPPPAQHSIGGALIGGVAGGILGNQVGKGSGRDAATAAGVIAGAVVGDRLANRDRVPLESEQRELRSCRTVYESQSRINGYRVSYEYNGQQYTTVMPQDPGRSLPVRVSVQPLEPEYHRR